MFEATPAAKVPDTVSFGEKFDDAFLFDCVEEVVAVAAFVGCQCRQVAAVAHTVYQFYACRRRAVDFVVGFGIHKEYIGQTYHGPVEVAVGAFLSGIIAYEFAEYVSRGRQDVVGRMFVFGHFSVFVDRER